MNFKLFFKGGSDFCLVDLNEKQENEVIKQMHRPQAKRNYVFGVEFSEVERAEGYE